MSEAVLTPARCKELLPRVRAAITAEQVSVEAQRVKSVAAAALAEQKLKVKQLDYAEKEIKFLECMNRKMYGLLQHYRDVPRNWRGATKKVAPAHHTLNPDEVYHEKYYRYYSLAVPYLVSFSPGEKRVRALEDLAALLLVGGTVTLSLEHTIILKDIL